MEAITIDVINAATKSELPTNGFQQSLYSIENKLSILENENKQLKERFNYLESIFLSRKKY